MECEFGEFFQVFDDWIGLLVSVRLIGERWTDKSAV